MLSLWRKLVKKEKAEYSPQWMRLYPRFKFQEIVEATSNFRSPICSDQLFTLYEGFIKESHKDIVTIKRFTYDKGYNSYFSDAFWREMEVLSNLKHPNIISPIGYCVDGSGSVESDMLVVFKYMPNGNLEDQLHGTSNPQKPILSWKKRLEICIGAGRGLEYVHTAQTPVIHRVVHPRNILLHHNWIAKISHFERSISVRDSDNPFSYDCVVGAYGYIDPEYLRTGRVTLKSDVYSFGVVLFEVLSGRKVIQWDLDLVERDLILLCKTCVEDGRLDKIVDPHLKDEIAPDCLKAYADIAYKCLEKMGNDRPTMSDVVKRLELIMLLQECTDAGIPFSPSWLTSIALPVKWNYQSVDMESICIDSDVELSPR